MLKRSTITDVARLAGVSKVTVSYVLNDQAAASRISAKTKERVLAAASELDYVPNANARSMVTKRADALGVVFQYAQYFAARSDFTKEVMLGISQAAVALGYDLVLHTKPFQDARAEFRSLTNGRVDGLLILRDQDDETLGLLRESGFPFVQFFMQGTDPDSLYVDCDNYRGGVLAAKHLLNLGHRRLGMLCGSSGSTSATERLKGFRELTESRNVRIQDRHLVSMVPGSEADTIEGFLRSPDRPTGLFCFSDEFAFLTCRIAANLGLSVPEDLSVIGFDSLDSCNHANPPLTSVRQPVMEMARAATQMLVHASRGAKIDEPHLVFSTELDVRASTAEPKVSS